MKQNAFQLFGSQHLVVLFLSLLFIYLFPILINKHASIFLKSTISKTLAIVMILNELSKPFYRTFFFDDLLIQSLPFHMCNLASILMGLYFITKKRLLFEISFYWAFTGGLMALITPDLTYAFPNKEWFPFFLGHNLAITSVFYAMYCFNEKPDKKSFKKVTTISLLILPVIYFLNYSLGYPANYWYLISKPEADSLANYLPDAPFHIIPIIFIAIFLFYLIQLPFRNHKN